MIYPEAEAWHELEKQIHAKEAQRYKCNLGFHEYGSPAAEQSGVNAYVLGTRCKHCGFFKKVKDTGYNQFTAVGSVSYVTQNASVSSSVNGPMNTITPGITITTSKGNK